MENIKFFKTSDTSSGGGSDCTNIKINSKSWNNVKINDEFTINFDDTLSSVMLQAFKIIEGEKNIIQTINTFNNENKDNFYFNANIVDITNTARIKDEYILPFFENEQGIYESEVINKNDFVDINNIIT